MIGHASVRRNVELGPLTTYKVGGPARFFAEPDGLEELRSVLEGTLEETPIVVLGRGSNVVISDEGFPGLVIRLGRGFGAIDVSPVGDVIAGAGTALPVLARTAARAGRGGLEFYVGIPGSVGGAVRMNAGGHGTDTAAVLTSTMILGVDSREVVSRHVADLGLGYRRSNLTDGDIVLQATFHTEAIDAGEAEATMREITRWRKEHQPGGTLNAGSVFKNPAGTSAGEIIDELGLKGHRLGPVSVSEVHANFLVAAKDATASDIFVFVQQLRSIVHRRAGIDLEPEIRFIGPFAESEFGR